MSPESVSSGIAALERLRGQVDDDVLDLALTPLLERLDALRRGEALGAPAQRLGVVTVMFVDVVGSTALGGKLDPESIHLVMDPALARFTDIVRRCHGRALQYAGDSMLAGFGTEGTREDDTEWAVTAGLAILREAQVLADRVRRDHGHPGFNVRVGLHTGPVLLGGGVDAENSIRGATVNLAARMEQNTAPGTLRISEDTYRSVQGLFDMAEQPPLMVKGYERPQRTWLVQQRRALQELGTQRGVAGGVETPRVGREPEWQALQHAWHALHTGPSAPHTFLLLGEAGLGKTRLARDWADWARAQPAPARWLSTRGRLRSQTLPFAALRTLFSTVFQLPEDAEVQSARDRWLASVAPLLRDGRDEAAAREDAQVLGHLLGLDFSESPALRGILQQAGQIRQRGLQAAAEVMAGLGQGGTQPLVILLEDAHWIDAGTLSFLKGLIRHPMTQGLRLLLLILARPGQADGTPIPEDGATVLRLNPLDEALRRALARALLAPLDPPSPALQALLVERAGGNPYYQEELLQMLLAQGVVEVTTETEADSKADAGHGPRWRLRATLPALTALPTTLAGVLQARLEALPADERKALRQAAVLGTVFREATLLAIAPESARFLSPLAARGLLKRQDIALDRAEATYAFSHAFLQEVALGQLLREARRTLHGHAARWYAAQTHALAADDWPLAAEHFAEAGEPDAAQRYHRQAAEHFATRFAHEAVKTQASRALALTEPSDTATRWPLLLLRQRALRQSGQGEAQTHDLEAMAAIAEQTADPVHEATVAVRRAVAADESGQSKLAASLAPPALEAAERAGDTALELLAYGVLCGSLRSAGRHAEARAAGERGLVRAKAIGDPTMEAELLVALSAVAAEQDDPVNSTSLLRRALHLQQTHGNRFGECLSRINLGATAQQLGDLVAAERDFDEAARLARHLGNPNFEVMSLLNRASVRLPQGRLDDALADADAAIRLAEVTRNEEYEAFARMTRGAVRLALAQRTQAADPGQSAEQSAQAMRDWARSAELLAALDLHHLAIEATAWQARGHWVRGEQASAMKCVEAVLAHLDTTGNLDGTENPLQIQSTCIEVLSAAHDPRAASLLTQAWAALQARCTELPNEETRSRFLQSTPACSEIQARAREAGLVS